MDESDPFFPYSRGLTFVYLPRDLTTVGISSSDMTIHIDPDVAPFPTALWMWITEWSWSLGVYDSDFLTILEDRGKKRVKAI
jgi:hypothetical protein